MPNATGTMKRGTSNTTKHTTRDEKQAITDEKSTIKTIIHRLSLPHPIDSPLGLSRYVQQQTQNPHAGAAHKNILSIET